MNLLFCIKAMNNPGGGAERVLSDIANGLGQRGHAVRVLTFETSGGRSFYPLDSGIERIDLGIGDTIGSSSASETAVRIAALRRVLNDRKPDVAIGFMHSMFLPLGLAALGTGVPVIASEHIVPQHYRSRPLQALLLRTAPYLVLCITCTSEAVKQAYPRSLRRKMVTIPNPVSLSPAGAADVGGEGSFPKTLLAVGRLEKQKDHATLIKAFAGICDRAPEWRLRIVGEGSLRSELEHLARNLGVKNKVDLPGSKQNIQAEYLSAQLFVLPSRYESFGLTTVEAMGHGLPAVGFADCLGTRDLIKSGVNGELVEAGADRAQSLGKALLRLMLNSDERRRLAHAARSTPDEYRLDAVVQRWDNLIRQSAAVHGMPPERCAD